MTNLNVYAGELITRGSTAVALVKQHSFYVMAYLERRKLSASVRATVPNYPAGSNHVIKGTVDSVAAGVTNASSSSVDSKGMATIHSTSNGFVWPSACAYRLDKQETGNLWPAVTTATVVITGEKDCDASRMSFFQKLALRLREFG
ncbi:hypothetical protein ACNKHQ_18905 [Shigella flexneri]